VAAAGSVIEWRAPPAIPGMLVSAELLHEAPDSADQPLRGREVQRRAPVVIGQVDVDLPPHAAAEAREVAPRARVAQDPRLVHERRRPAPGGAPRQQVLGDGLVLRANGFIQGRAPPAVLAAPVRAQLVYEALNSVELSFGRGHVDCGTPVMVDCVDVHPAAGKLAQASQVTPARRFAKILNIG